MITTVNKMMLLLKSWSLPLTADSKRSYCTFEGGNFRVRTSLPPAAPLSIRPSVHPSTLPAVKDSQRFQQDNQKLFHLPKTDALQNKTQNTSMQRK